jgi:hypothetical protein
VHPGLQLASGEADCNVLRHECADRTAPLPGPLYRVFMERSSDSGFDVIPDLPKCRGGRVFLERVPSKCNGDKMWTKLDFGKHAGRTLPQVVLLDPNWFFWAFGKGIFPGPLADEAAILAHRATHIKIPKRKPRTWEVQYRHERDGRFIGFGFVDAKSPSYGCVTRLPYVDLSHVRRGNIHDKRDCRRMIREVRAIYFGGLNLTKKRCEAFFDRERNFVKVKA